MYHVAGNVNDMADEATRSQAEPVSDERGSIVPDAGTRTWSPERAQGTTVTSDTAARHVAYDVGGISRVIEPGAMPPGADSSFAEVPCQCAFIAWLWFTMRCTPS